MFVSLMAAHTKGSLNEYQGHMDRRGSTLAKAQALPFDSCMNEAQSEGDRSLARLRKQSPEKRRHPPLKNKRRGVAQFTPSHLSFC